ncbi:MAG: exodeoxyribonuclease V subunit beta [Deltaproteobacteria bacterium]|nr:exodeoxyribonuclease V subunit beta [Deltaproteobacteria bacterium]
MKPFTILDAPLVGRNLIEASAGTGKTYAIAGLFVRLLVEKGLTVDQILVVTFTEAATGELRDRIRRRIREALAAFADHCGTDPLLEGLLARIDDPELAKARLTLALSSFDEAAIHTIHGFCQRTLAEMAFESASLFDTELMPNPQPLFQEIVDDFWRRSLMETDQAFVNWVEASGTTVEDLARLARRWGRRPGLTVLPDEAEPDTNLPVLEYREALAEARKEFAGSRDRIREILLSDAGLNRGRYRAASIPGWVDAMGGWLERPLPLETFNGFDKFRTSVIDQSLKKVAEAPRHRFFDLCDTLAGRLDTLRRALALRLCVLKRGLLEHVRTELPRRKRRLNARTFDDLLLDLDEALSAEAGDDLARAIRHRFPAALVDEFQDTDTVQYSIFRSVFRRGDPALFFIGDPKQAIYGFRGADVFAYMAAKAETKPDSRWTLGTNYRSVPGLVTAINALFQGHDDPFLFDAIPFVPVGAADRPDRDHLFIEGRVDQHPLQVWLVDGKDGKPRNKGDAEGAIRKAVAGEIVRLLERATHGEAALSGTDDPGDGRPLEPGDMAVLVRTNRQARDMQQELRSLGVPSVLHGDASLFESPEAAEALMVLAGVADPWNEAAVRAALITDMVGMSANDLARQIEDDDAWAERLARFHGYRELWARRSFMTMARSFLSLERVRERLLAFPDGERRLTNVLHCIDVLHQAAVEHNLGVDGLLKWLTQQLNDCPDREEYQIRLETDEKAVKLVTIHKSKGLEYPVVFVPFAWGVSGVRRNEPLAFHPREDGPKMVLDLGPVFDEAHAEQAGREGLAEDLRLLYVAVTRARHRCHLVWGDIRDASLSALGYLMPEDPGTLEASSGNAVELSPLPGPGEDRYRPATGPEDILACRPLKEAVPREWTITSFSRLTSGAGFHVEAPDHDASGPVNPWDEPGADTKTHSIMDFPAGTRAGTFLHDVFEHVDFQNPQDGLVLDMLRRHGFDEEWEDVVTDTVSRVLRAPLMDGFSLSLLGKNERVHEMEFTFPVGLLESQGLPRALPAHREALEQLAFTPHRGQMRGFIDLVFRHAGRFYLLDWKSNLLGSRIQDYGHEPLARAMERDLYVLQYHVYTAALHRHLAARLPGYHYDTHFGGAFYLFLRGVPDGAGVFFHRPDRTDIERLDRYFRGEGP